jgi:ATP-binding protein involved in chromosome partitioning
MALTQEQVVAALRTVKDPELYKDIVTLGLVKELAVEENDVGVRLGLSSPQSGSREQIEAELVKALRRIGAEEIEIAFLPPGQAQQQSGPTGPAAAPGRPGGPGPAGAASMQQAAPNALPQVKHIIAVGAGKGGVGKSTVAVNLAVGLHRTGATVGLMDGDIYGPSLPTMLGIKGKSPMMSGNQIKPFEVHGIHAITIGALVEQDKPLIWRGPMAHGAFKQLLLDNTDWPPLDYLIVDLPPGTGDVSLSLCQLLRLTGAVVVATPQQVALDDAVRAVRMVQQLGAPILGMVENMSYFVAPDGAEHDIFGRGGTERSARKLGLPYLGAIPMFPELRVNSDAGNPTKNFEGNAKLRQSLEAVVTNLQQQVAARDLGPKGPQLTVI